MFIFAHGKQYMFKYKGYKIVSMHIEKVQLENHTKKPVCIDFSFQTELAVRD